MKTLKKVSKRVISVGSKHNQQSIKEHPLGNFSSECKVRWRSAAVLQSKVEKRSGLFEKTWQSTKTILVPTLAARYLKLMRPSVRFCPLFLVIYLNKK